MTANLNTLKERIKNGGLKYYRYTRGHKGERVLNLYFWGSVMPDPVISPDYQDVLRPLLEAFDKSRARPPSEYADCNCYVAEAGGCKALKEMFCITRGKCSCYKSKKDEKEK